jgi:hypothetical protein
VLQFQDFAKWKKRRINGSVYSQHAYFTVIALFQQILILEKTILFAIKILLSYTG